MPELIANGVNGLLCQPDNSVDIARGMMHLMTDEALRHRMSKAATASIAKYEIRHTINELEQTYGAGTRWLCTHRGPG